MLKITFSKLFENMLNITIKVNANGCRPENGRIPLIVQWYKLVHFMIVLIIDLYLNLFNFVTSLGVHYTHFFCRFITTYKDIFLVCSLMKLLLDLKW